MRVIAGRALGAGAVIDTRIPIHYLHFTLEPGAMVEQPLPGGANAFAYVFGGEGVFDGQRVGIHNLVVYHRDGNSVQLEAPGDSKGPLEVLLLAGKPIVEPGARYGPFVMNTKEEIAQAVEDYRSGRMGAIAR